KNVPQNDDASAVRELLGRAEVGWGEWHLEIGVPGIHDRGYSFTAQTIEVVRSPLSKKFSRRKRKVR
ncbi:MAG: hypothetical protein Q8P21_02210, partial [bacterium]|nr:hypothetical protein [bacterium]